MLGVYRQVGSDSELNGKSSARWRQLLRPDVFASRQYVVLCVNNTLLCFGLSVVYVHLYAFAVGSHPDDEDLAGETVRPGYTDPASAALLLSTIGAANLVGRFVFGLLASARPVNRHNSTKPIQRAYIDCSVTRFMDVSPLAPLTFAPPPLRAW